MSRVFIAGQNGFLGKHLAQMFKPIEFGQKADYRKPNDANMAMAHTNPDIVINAAGKVGGIEANRKYPADFYHDNIRIGLNLIEAARNHDVKKFVQIGTVCSYPESIQTPMCEEDFWKGLPEQTNGAYGMAKRAIIAYAQACATQYKFNVINPILANLYGPGDHYDDDKSHVIPAMIKKFVEAIEFERKKVVFWGSGECTREFLYVEDAAKAIRFLITKYDFPEIINVSSGYEIKIKDLADMIGAACGFKGDIDWDISKPDGQPRRHFDTLRMERLGWQAKTSLSSGIFNTVTDYKTRRKQNAVA